jgi:hypothetical protein
MGKTHPRRLVIDASISHAAGNRLADQSRLCTMALKAVAAAQHRVVMSVALTEEWKRHQTRFARGWLLSRYAQRLVERLDVTADEALRTRVERVAPEPGVAAIMLKDMHLVEAARASEQRILSLDDRARHHFRQAAGAVHELRPLCWVNPGKAAEQAAEWLAAGAPADRHRKLGHVPSEE